MSSSGTAPSVCPRCKTPVFGTLQSCLKCGEDFRPESQRGGASAPAFMARPGFVAVGRGMSVCHHCGAIAPRDRTSCEVCEKPIGSSLEAVPKRSDDLSFAQVRTYFTCRQCGSEVPLGEPELDEAITCPRCNTRQAFEGSAWSEAFDHAHFIADVYGPRGEEFRRSFGAGDPFPRVGGMTAVATLKLTGIVISGGVQRTRNLRADCAPGAPLCEKCGSPRDPSLVAGAGGAEELQMRCVGCGDTARYGIPRQARALAPTLVGVVAEAFRTDRPAAKLNQTSAGMVVALGCPSCGAPLHASTGSNVAVCSFCKTEARIASRTLLAMKQVEGEAPPWWAVFRGDARGRGKGRRRKGASQGGSASSDQPLVIGGGATDAAELAALLAVAEVDGGKSVANAMARVISQPADAVTKAQRAREWTLQLVLPAIALVLVAPFFLMRVLGQSASESPALGGLLGAIPGQPFGPPPGTMARVLVPATGLPATTPPPVIPGGAAEGPYIVIVSHEGQNLPVCAQGFGFTEAMAACREMGFTAALGFYTVQGFSDRFWLTQISCSGTETRLEDCRHPGWGVGVEACTRDQTVAVFCSP